MAPGISSTMTMKRIHREIADLKREDLGPISLEPSESNLNIWKGSIPGPEGSLYEGGVFDVEIVLPADYPFSAPKVVFKTRIYHMNISEHGNICIDILKHNWSPALSLFKVMLSLSSLLTDPNPRDPLVPSIATQYVRNRKLHDTTARDWTRQFARPTPVTTPVAPPEIPSATANGKRRAVEAPLHTAGAGGSATAGRATRSSSSAQVIVLDSDDEATAVRGQTVSARSKAPKRKRGETETRQAPVQTGEVLELLDSDEERDAAKKARTRSDNNQNTGSSVSTSSRRPARQLGEVIVID